MRFVLPYFTLLVLLCSACTKDKVATPDTAKHIPYGSNSAQQFDFYPPEKSVVDKCPVILLIHGGGWVWGGAPACPASSLYDSFRTNGYAIVDMNYRLATDNAYPAQLDDIDSLLSFLQAHAADYRIDPQRICLMGQSAGAHLSMLYAYARNTRKNVKMVIDVFGPFDLTDSTVQTHHLRFDLTTLLQHHTYASDPQLWHDASPAFYMKNALPTIIFHGTADTTVYTEQSDRLNDSLAAHQLPHRYYKWQGIDHNWYEAGWQEHFAQVHSCLQSYL
ncbi:MAG: alpha/beta fold hydrolase [Flavipsychrobacter sp.]